MLRCNNCGELAAYTCADPGLNPVNYCANCLPVWLQERANAGSFPLVETIQATVEPTSEPTSEPAPTVEETAPSDTPAEEAKPASSKKKAVSEDANNN
jgi:hypothetical protein